MSLLRTLRSPGLSRSTQALQSCLSTTFVGSHFSTQPHTRRMGSSSSAPASSSSDSTTTSAKVTPPTPPTPPTPTTPPTPAAPIFTPLPVSYEDVSRAHYRIQSGVRRTHCDISQFLSEICGCKVYLKKDFTQFTGSFKERGGRNSLMMLSPELKKKGVVTASAGNHALALSWHGKDLGIPVTCVMPSVAPLTKVILSYHRF